MPPLRSSSHRVVSRRSSDSIRHRLAGRIWWDTHKRITTLGDMSTYSPATPPPRLDRPAIERLRADLESAQWSVEHVETRMGSVATAALGREQRIPALVRLRRDTSPAALLTRLFMLGDAVSGHDLDRALPTLGTEGALNLGLITQRQDTRGHTREGTWVSTVDLRPHAATLPDPQDQDRQREYHWWILSDLGESTTGKPLHPDHVLGIGGATTSLLRLTVRRRLSRALDLGCGCGIQALYLATHVDHVVATDLSPRACAITRFNAALNNSDIDVRQGSLFDPVAGQTFDLITSNPPFVITPESVRAGGLLEYRDAGMSRDNLVATLIVHAHEYLSEGGTLQMLANWEIPAEADPHTDWSFRVTDWLGDAPVDTWVVQRDILDPAAYAELWLRDSGGHLMARQTYEADYAAWIADFEDAGVGAIGMGFVVARRIGKDTTPIRVFDLAMGGMIPRGHEVEAALDSLRLRQPLEDLTLLRAADVTEERHFTPGDTDPRVIVLRQGGGMGQAIHVGSAVSALVGASDGELTVKQILSALAQIMGEDEEALREQILPVVARLLRMGMLRVAAPRSGQSM